MNESVFLVCKEMKLFESAYDGDIESVRSVLSKGVPVDVTYQVRL